jgi:hypothetical protein
LRRTLWLVYAALQLLLPGAASIADARLEAASIASHPTAHVEEHGTPQCARVHPSDCALCRVISATARPTTAAHLAPTSPTRVAPSASAPSRVAQRDGAATRSRAPPVIA